ncbi:MAG TPA: rod shape-determining protein MreC, partial [Gemmatirosa sp.]
MLGICVGVALLASLLPTVVRDRTAAGVRRTVAAPLAMLEQWTVLRRAAFLSYDDRVQARGALTREAQDAIALRAENARLRSLLALGARLEWGFVTAEAVPNQQAGELGSGQTLQEFKVTAGSRAGVAVFTPVVAPAGLVGMVQQVDQVRSQVISYAHPDFRVSAQADSAYGIVQPHLGSGADRGLLELHGVAFRNPLKAGQPVISSGLGGTYPAGIPIGTVVREIQTPERWARTYLLQPAVNLAEVGPVLLLLRPRADRGLDSVWTSVHAVDVTSRRVAAAGDSIQREELSREAAARRAALDSARADSTRRDSTAGTGGDSSARGEGSA